MMRLEVRLLCRLLFNQLTLTTFHYLEIMSDDHAMYEESTNASAFAKRGSPVASIYSHLLKDLTKCPPASPRKDKLPSVHAPRVFCRT